MEGSTILVGLGNPLLDIIANVEPELLEKYKLAKNGTKLVTEQNREFLLPIFDELSAKENVEILVGGSVLNTIRVFQWMIDNGKRKHKLFATFFGSIGDDGHAEMFIQKSREAGVDVQFRQIKEMPTGKCATLVNGENRSMCALLGAANHFHPNYLDTKIIENAQYFYTAGFFLPVSLEAIFQLTKHCLENDKIFAFNLSAAYIPREYKRELAIILPYVHFLFGNEEEAISFARENYELFDGIEMENLGGIAKRIANFERANSKRNRLVLITRGPMPIIVAQYGQKEVREFPAPNIPIDKFVDTNGAGDAFVGGFLAALVDGNYLEKCMEFGCNAAAIIIQNRGCTFPDYQL